MDSQWATVFNKSELNDDGYEISDGSEEISLRCFTCNNWVDGFISHGVIMNCTCDVCGAKI